MRLHRSLLERGQMELRVQAVQIPNFITLGNGIAVEQAALPVLVHRHAPSDRDQEELLRQGDAATAGPQPLRTHLGDDAQDTFGHGAAR